MITTVTELTVPEAAALLGISPDAVRMAIHRKRLRSTKKGRDHFIEPAEVERYATENLGRGRKPKPKP